MAKRISAVLLIVAVIMLYPNLAHARFGVDWRNSADNPSMKGTDYLATWLVDNNYYTNLNTAKAFARTGYIGHDRSDADPFYWNMGKDSTTFKVEQEIAGYADSNILGFYQGSGSSKTLTQIFGGTENGPKTLSISGDFGLYLNTPENNFWYTNRRENKSEQDGRFYNRDRRGDPQALIYELVKGKEWLVAWEDLDATRRGSDNDYNDMYVKVTATPEPISAALFLIGGSVVGLFNSRKRKK